MKISITKIWLSSVKVFVLWIITLVKLFSQSPEINGQISAWGTFYNEDETKLNGGIRFIPEFNLTKEISDESFLDFNFSINSYLYKTETSFDKKIDLYRLKFRYATSQSELRIGLQKINFGPARILRSLRWFDSVDPTDPLKLTNGVYAFRYKYNFLNNSEIWFWVLYGNDELRGNDLITSDKKTPEFGGRFSYPLFNGEFAATFNQRKARFNNIDVNETRFALDGRFEIEAGFWFESVITKFEKNKFVYNWQNSVTIGSDYTFDIGNGLMFTAEHQLNRFAEDFSSGGNSINTTAMSAAYAFGLIDNFSGFLFYNWNIRQFYQTFQWNRVYDNYILNFNFYRYPETTSGLVTDKNQNITRAGYGFQFTLIFNF